MFGSVSPASLPCASLRCLVADMLATQSTVTLSSKAIRALDLHRLSELDEKLRTLAMQHLHIERQMRQMLTERAALRTLVGQADDDYICPF